MPRSRPSTSFLKVALLLPVYGVVMGLAWLFRSYRRVLVLLAALALAGAWHLSACSHRLRIGTIDSFFAKLAQSFALELALPPRWRIATNDEDDRIRAAALSATLAEDPAHVTELVRALGGGAGRRSVAEDLADRVRQLYELFLDSDQSASQE